LTHWVICRTCFGLRLRAVGENPQAVDTAGISVSWLRYRAVLLCGLLTGIAGTYLALAQNAGFSREMTAGQGYIALAALIFGKWRPYAPSRLLAVQKPAIAASDGNDRVLDGIIDDPRTCHFDASANICGNPNAPAAPDCLTTAEATAFNKIWDGPRNEKGNRICFPLDRGSDFAIVDGLAPFQLGVIQFEWDEKDPSYAAGIQPGNLFGPPPPSRWDTVTLAGPGLDYPRQVAQEGSRNIADVTDTFGPLDTFKEHGGKMMTLFGGNDQFIYPRAVINYYRVLAARYQTDHDQTGFKGVQSFYRLFHATGVGHCGIPAGAFGPDASLGDIGPWPQSGVDFDALVDWVEPGIAPSQVIGQSSGPAATPPLPPVVPVSPDRAVHRQRQHLRRCQLGLRRESGNATGRLSRYTGSV
jgi:hypothetical protein